MQMRTVWRIVVGLAGVTMIAACGAAGSTSTTVQLSMSQQVVVHGSLDHGDTIDWNDPRLAHIVSETSRLVGHPVQFDFYVAEMPRPRGAFLDHLFERDLGHIPHDLERLKSRDPLELDYGSHALRQIALRYDGSVSRPEVTFTVSSGVLDLRMGGDGPPVPYDTVSYAFDEAFEAHLHELFDDRHAADVGSDTFPLYFRYLKDVAYHYRHGAAFADDPRWTAIADMTVLARRVGDSDHELAGAIREWLVRRADHFEDAYIHHAGDVRDALAGSPWHRAEQAWESWVSHEMAKLNDHQRLELARHIFVPHFGDGHERRYDRDAFADIDHFAFGLRAIDRWIQAGHPAPERLSRHDDQQRLFNVLVCPPRPDTSRMRDAPSGCDQVWYRWVLGDPALRDRLGQELLRRHDPRLTEAVFANVWWIGGDQAAVLDLLHAIEDDAAQWAVAVAVLGEDIDYHGRSELRSALYDEAVRVWRHRPERRGDVLYLLAMLDRQEPERERVVPWDSFRRTFGSLAGAQDFQKYLSHGGEALVAAPLVWPALGSGFSRIALVLPVLEHYVADDTLRRRHRGRFPYETLRDLANAVKHARDRGEAARYKAWLEARSQEHPSDARMYQTLLEVLR